jgi:uncharacterized protein YacL
MTLELALRLLGMVICTLVGARLGADLPPVGLARETTAVVFGLLGSLVGLILTPYVTTRPARAAARRAREAPAEILLTSIVGLIFGLVVGALLSAPLSSLPDALGQWMPTVVAIVFAYLGVIIFGYRAIDIFNLTRQLFRDDPRYDERFGDQPIFNEVQILVDSSAIIDGRLLHISKTGFLSGHLLVPSFILRELQHIADDSDPQRRARGRRGLDIVEQMKSESKVPVDIVDVDVEGVREVDHKLIELCKQMNALLLTTDHNLNRTAQLQGVQVLNINDLALAVKAVLLPGDVIALQVIGEGREPGQGVGYLEDGTMVVVEEGRRHIDRTIDVVITRMLQTTAGKMYFARLEENPRK